MLRLVPFLLLLYALSTSLTFAGGGHGHNEEHDEHEDGLIRITDVGMELSEIEIAKASKRDLVLDVEVNGFVVPNNTLTSDIRPRYPGIVKSVLVQLGDKVKKGQTLAVVQANRSETNFPVKANFAGTLTDKNSIQGQFVSAQHSMFTIANLSTVWVHLSIPETYISKVKREQKVSITDWSSKRTLQSTISFVAPTMSEDSQSTMARIEIPNRDGKWRPGLFVKALIEVETIPNIIAIAKSAIQTLEEKTVVFVEEEEGVFRPQAIEIGLKNATHVEVLAGLSEKDRYVSENSYILKADYLKSEASHEH